MSRLSRAQKREIKRAGRSQAGSGTASSDVRVPTSGEGATAGDTAGVALPGEPPQSTVPHHLYRLALAIGYPVRATVHDERIAAAPFRVLSSPNGEHGPAPEPGRVSAPPPAPMTQQVGAPGSAPEATAPRFWEPRSGPEAAPAPAPFIISVAEVDEDAPKAAPVREFAVAEAVMGVAEADGTAPSPLAEPAGRISEAVRSGRIREAAELAELTMDQATATLGPLHPEVLGLRELSAYIAYLAGDALGSFQHSLELARLGHRLGDPRAAYGNVQSAAAAWRAVRDPLKGLDLGCELIAVWTELAAGAGPAADDIEQLETARTRMGRLAGRARALDAADHERGPQTRGR